MSQSSSSSASLWTQSGLVPSLLKAAPERALPLSFGAGSGSRKHTDAPSTEAGAHIDVDQLAKQPTIDWPLDSENPDALWTVACMDLDWVADEPETRQRTTQVAQATPLAQRLVWLVINAPAPHLVDTGLVLCPWDAQIEQLQSRKGVHRMVLLAFRQRAPVESKSLKAFKSDEAHHDESQRVRSLSKLLHAQEEIISDHPWAGSFFVVDCQDHAAGGKSNQPIIHGVDSSLSTPDLQQQRQQDAKDRQQDRRAAADLKAARMHAGEGYALGTEPEAPRWDKREEQAEEQTDRDNSGRGTAKLH